MRVRILTALAWCVALVAFGQSTEVPSITRPLSLQACIDLALSRNLDLQIEHLVAGIAGYNLSGAYGAYNPVVSLGGQHAFVSEPANFDPEKFNLFYPAQIDTDSGGSALEGLVPIGLSYKFSGEVKHVSATTDFHSNPDYLESYPSGIRETNNFMSDAGVTLRQHLLKDFWIDSARKTVLIRRKELSMSQQALKFQIMKTVLAVEVGYYDLIAARELIRVQEKTLGLRRQLVAEIKRRVEVGDLPPLDSDQAESQLQNTLTALSLAREAYATQQNHLKRLVTDNFRELADVDFQPTEVLVALPAEVNRSESFQHALKNRPDLLEARLAIEKQAVVVKFQRNQLFPSLDVVGHYGGLAVEPGLGSAIDQVFRFSNPDYFYGVVISYPIGNSAARANYRTSQAAKQIAELQLKTAEEEVLVQIADCVNRLQSRLSQVSSTRKARSFAEAALVAEQKKFQNGLSTSFFVLEFQEKLTAARTAEVQALTEYNRTLAQMAFAEGSTLTKHHLALESK
jgi:outer membrane protein TolC